MIDILEVPNEITGDITALGFGRTAIIKTSASTYTVEVDLSENDPERTKLQGKIDKAVHELHLVVKTGNHLQVHIIHLF
jgi:hypothetical protein